MFHGRYWSDVSCKYRVMSSCCFLNSIQANHIHRLVCLSIYQAEWTKDDAGPGKYSYVNFSQE